LRRVLGQAVSGVYVHGSAALGGWTPTSDLDMLITSAANDRDWPTIGYQLLSNFAPVPVVELSIVSVAAAASPEPPWPFLLHVNQDQGRVVTDDGRGDPDLLMHYLVARRGGIAVTGPSASVAFGAVPRTSVSVHLRDELAWALNEADQRYAVLNACRALAYFRDGLVLSKIDGGRWALAQGFNGALIKTALTAQEAGHDLGRPTSTARVFVGQCMSQLGN